MVANGDLIQYVGVKWSGRSVCYCGRPVVLIGLFSVWTGHTEEMNLSLWAI